MALKLELEGKEESLKLLGLDNSASSDDIKKAYKELALLHHPDHDANKDKPEATERFQQISQAFLNLRTKYRAGNTKFHCCRGCGRIHYIDSDDEDDFDDDYYYEDDDESWSDDPSETDEDTMSIFYKKIFINVFADYIFEKRFQTRNKPSGQQFTEKEEEEDKFFDFIYQKYRLSDEHGDFVLTEDDLHKFHSYEEWLKDRNPKKRHNNRMRKARKKSNKKISKDKNKYPKKKQLLAKQFRREKEMKEIAEGLNAKMTENDSGNRKCKPSDRCDSTSPNSDEEVERQHKKNMERFLSEQEHLNKLEAIQKGKEKKQRKKDMKKMKKQIQLDAQKKMQEDNLPSKQADDDGYPPLHKVNLKLSSHLNETDTLEKSTTIAYDLLSEHNAREMEVKSRLLAQCFTTGKSPPSVINTEKGKSEIQKTSDSITDKVERSKSKLFKISETGDSRKPAKSDILKTSDSISDKVERSKSKLLKISETGESEKPATGTTSHWLHNMEKTFPSTIRAETKSMSTGDSRKPAKSDILKTSDSISDKVERSKSKLLKISETIGAETKSMSTVKSEKYTPPSSTNTDNASTDLLQKHLAQYNALMTVQPKRHTEQQLRQERSEMREMQLKQQDDELSKLRDHNIKQFNSSEAGRGDAERNVFDAVVDEEFERMRKEHLRKQQELERMRNEEEVKQLKMEKRNQKWKELPIETKWCEREGTSVSRPKPEPVVQSPSVNVWQRRAHRQSNIESLRPKSAQEEESLLKKAIELSQITASKEEEERKNKILKDNRNVTPVKTQIEERTDESLTNSYKNRPFENSTDVTFRKVSLDDSIDQKVNVCPSRPDGESMPSSGFKSKSTTNSKNELMADKVKHSRDSDNLSNTINHCSELPQKSSAASSSLWTTVVNKSLKTSTKSVIKENDQHGKKCKTQKAESKWEVPPPQPMTAQKQYIKQKSVNMKYEDQANIEEKIPVLTRNYENLKPNIKFKVESQVSVDENWDDEIDDLIVSAKLPVTSSDYMRWQKMATVLIEENKKYEEAESKKALIMEQREKRKATDRKFQGINDKENYENQNAANKSENAAEMPVSEIDKSVSRTDHVTSTNCNSSSNVQNSISCKTKNDTFTKRMGFGVRPTAKISNTMNQETDMDSTKGLSMRRAGETLSTEQSTENNTNQNSEKISQNAVEMPVSKIGKPLSEIDLKASRVDNSLSNMQNSSSYKVKNATFTKRTGFGVTPRARLPNSLKQEANVENIVELSKWRAGETLSGEQSTVVQGKVSGDQTMTVKSSYGPRQSYVGENPKNVSNVENKKVSNQENIKVENETESTTVSEKQQVWNKQVQQQKSEPTKRQTVPINNVETENQMEFSKQSFSPSVSVTGPASTITMTRELCMDEKVSDSNCNINRNSEVPLIDQSVLSVIPAETEVEQLRLPSSKVQSLTVPAHGESDDNIKITAKRNLNRSSTMFDKMNKFGLNPNPIKKRTLPGKARQPLSLLRSKLDTLSGGKEEEKENQEDAETLKTLRKPLQVGDVSKHAEQGTGGASDADVERILKKINSENVVLKQIGEVATAMKQPSECSVKSLNSETQVGVENWENDLLPITDMISLNGPHSPEQTSSKPATEDKKSVKEDEYKETTSTKNASESRRLPVLRNLASKAIENNRSSSLPRVPRLPRSFLQEKLKSCGRNSLEKASVRKEENSEITSESSENTKSISSSAQDLQSGEMKSNKTVKMSEQKKPLSGDFLLEIIDQNRGYTGNTSDQSIQSTSPIQDPIANSGISARESDVQGKNSPLQDSVTNTDVSTSRETAEQDKTTNPNSASESTAPLTGNFGSIGNGLSGVNPIPVGLPPHLVQAYLQFLSSSTTGNLPLAPSPTEMPSLPSMPLLTTLLPFGIINPFMALTGQMFGGLPTNQTAQPQSVPNPGAENTNNPSHLGAELLNRQENPVTGLKEKSLGLGSVGPSSGTTGKTSENEPGTSSLSESSAKQVSSYNTCERSTVEQIDQASQGILTSIPQSQNITRTAKISDDQEVGLPIYRKGVAPDMTDARAGIPQNLLQHDQNRPIRCEVLGESHAEKTLNYTTAFGKKSPGKITHTDIKLNRSSVRTANNATGYPKASEIGNSGGDVFSRNIPLSGAVKKPQLPPSLVYNQQQTKVVQDMIEKMHREKEMREEAADNLTSESRYF